MKILVAFLLLLSTFHCFSQQNGDDPLKQNSITLHLGSNQFKEENLHPKVFSGLILGASYSHAKIAVNTSVYCAGLKISLLSTVYEEFPGAIGISLFGNYKYLITVASKNNLVYSLGPILDLQYGTNAYLNWDESHFYFANYISGGVSNRISYSLGKSSLELNLDIPLISIICRPKPNRQYKIDEITFTGMIKNLTSNPEFAFPNKHFSVKSGIDWKYNSKRSVGYSFKYHFMQADAGKPYQNIEQAIHYKFMF
jgi:hypothetical protein